MKLKKTSTILFYIPFLKKKKWHQLNKLKFSFTCRFLSSIIRVICIFFRPIFSHLSFLIFQILNSKFNFLQYPNASYTASIISASSPRATAEIFCKIQKKTQIRKFKFCEFANHENVIQISNLLLCCTLPTLLGEISGYIN